VEAGADYIGVGPVFQTFTKADVVSPVGLEYVRYAARHVPIPWVAIGGIKRHNMASVLAAGARWVAMVSELVEADDIRARVAEVMGLFPEGV
jgi:thiamine-phosphate pyrophosphorylase